MKKENLKKYSLVVLVMCFVGASSLQAQQFKRGERPEPRQEQQRGQQGMEMNQKGPRGPHIPNLTEEQKEQMHAFQIEFHKSALPIENQVGEKEARLKTLTTASSYDERAVNKVIDEIGDLKTELMKLKVANGQKIKSILTDEQSLAFNKQKRQGPKHENGGKPQRGPRPGGR